MRARSNALSAANWTWGNRIHTEVYPNFKSSIQTYHKDDANLNLLRFGLWADTEPLAEQTQPQNLVNVLTLEVLASAAQAEFHFRMDI